uniref:Uncharacterized protein n=1 Tax=Rousettus aegyptiacus TaxID=9407 RepID=A0A7J8E8D4_ROUAE|nr:hypothetical protein HJG63_008121 [Rousettus aegyptiacus]
MALPSVPGHLQTSENWNGTKRCRKDEFSLRLIKLRHPPSPVPRHGCSRSSGLQTRFELHHHSPCLSGLHVKDLGAPRSVHQVCAFSGHPYLLVPLLRMLANAAVYISSRYVLTHHAFNPISSSYPLKTAVSSPPDTPVFSIPHTCFIFS